MDGRASQNRVTSRQANFITSYILNNGMYWSGNYQLLSLFFVYNVIWLYERSMKYIASTTRDSCQSGVMC
jgi:hypothetical protein